MTAVSAVAARRRLLLLTTTRWLPVGLVFGLTTLLPLERGLTVPEIARRLYVSLNTLRTHTKRIFTKLDVTSRPAAVRRARERGLL